MNHFIFSNFQIQISMVNSHIVHLAINIPLPKLNCAGKENVCKTVIKADETYTVKLMRDTFLKMLLFR